MRALKTIISTNKHSLPFLFETKISSFSHLTRLSKSLGSSGSSGGIFLFWKIDVDVRILVSNFNLINALVFSNKDELP